MLPAAHRMRTAADFTDTTRRGSKVTRGCVVVYVTTGDAAGAPRVGLIVNRAVGNSVVRHRVARRIRGAMAPLLQTLPTGARLVVRALPGAGSDPGLPDTVASAVAAALARTTGQD